MAAFLKAKVWPGITGKQGNNKIDIIRAVKVGKRHAVELIGRYVDIQEKGNGVVLARVVVLLQKNAKACRPSSTSPSDALRQAMTSN